MAKKIGLWIDHRRAIIIAVNGKDGTLNIVESNIERRPHATGGSPASTPYGSQDTVAEDKLNRKWELHLSRYFDEVISSIKNAEAIFILGPGQAKFEFRKRLTQKQPDSNVVGIETTDKMTEKEIQARVIQFYQKIK